MSKTTKLLMLREEEMLKKKVYEWKPKAMCLRNDGIFCIWTKSHLKEPLV